jgi:beta-xylosidase
LAQDEESGKRMILPVVTQEALGPQYIRIDHIYDFYGVVRRDAGVLVFDWTKLDETVDDILATGAKPFLSLSYMPSAISSGSEIDNPANWGDWELTVQRTVEHFSRDRGIADVYYEVWNEPDLFGSYKTYGDKNYLNLYSHSVVGAGRAGGTKPYKIGGPATTALYENWVKSLLKFASNNNLRIDFLSWHKYSKDLGAYEKDIESVDKWLLDFPQYSDIELMITEIGPNSDNDKVYDGYFGAIHALDDG